MQGDVVKKALQELVWQAYRVKEDDDFIWCKHCQQGYVHDYIQAKIAIDGGDSLESHVVHKEDCIIVEAQNMLAMTP